VLVDCKIAEAKGTAELPRFIEWEEKAFTEMLQQAHFLHFHISTDDFIFCGCQRKKK
jgi:hypothetical protein